MQLIRTTLTTVFACILTALSLHAQQDYFQQEVNYTIEATLIDKQHVLEAQMTIEYINNSPDELSTLIFHLWPNAYQNANTAFAQQKVNTNNADFYFADAEDWGGFLDVQFTQGETALTYESLDGQVDIVTLSLDEPIPAGGRTELKIDFVLDVPASFSRLGHVGDSYQMTQWYPKPAVYDRDGWHPMPYLDQGEFYSEFGDFDVKITLPENYVVGASGQLQTESEKAFLKAKMASTAEHLELVQADIKNGTYTDRLMVAIPSAEEMKTIHYIAEDVHDFAWFADKAFYVVGDVITLDSGKEVETYVMFTEKEADLWKDAITYVNRSVKFYSDKVGEYPWPHATAVQSALSAGAGMEYPMITVIGLSGNAKSLDRVITHEVGHNWFYGILGSNERMHAWMDEGLNSYYENRYMATYWKDDAGVSLPNFLAKDTDYDLNELLYQVLVKQNAAQAPSTDAEDTWQGCYFLGAYVRVPFLWSYVDEYLGEEAVDSMMHAYFEAWKFKHPSPADLQLVMENHSDLDYDWIFDHAMSSEDPMDYKVVSVSDKRVLIRNKGVMDAPIHVVAFNGDEIVDDVWVEGFEGDKEIRMNLSNATRVHIDPEYQSPEYVRSNNYSAMRGLLKKVDKPGFRMLSGIDRDRKNDIYMLPLPFGNAYEGFMLAPILHNYEFPAHRFKYMLMPVVGFRHGTLSGIGDVKWTIPIRNNEMLRSIELGYNFKSFIFDQNAAQNDYLQRYRRHAPRLQFLFNANRAKGAYSALTVRYLDVKQEEAQFVGSDFSAFEYEGNAILDANYEFQTRRAVNSWSLEANFRQLVATDSDFDRDFSRVSLTFNKDFTYDKGRNFRLRMFGGYFISNENRNSLSDSGRAFQLTGNGHELDDAWYDDHIIGRNMEDGLWSKQVVIRDAGFKNAFPRAFSSISGNSNNMMIAANLMADLPVDLPLKLPLKPYFDLAYSAPGPLDATGPENIWYSGGIAFQLPLDILSIYFPIIHSENLQDLYLSSGQDSFFKQISFSLNLDFVQVDKTMNKLGL